jgi:hypothetical protein
LSLRGDNKTKDQSRKKTEQKEANNNKVVRTQPRKQIVSNILPEMSTGKPNRIAVFDIADNSNAVTSPPKSVFIATSNIISTTDSIIVG